MRNLEFGIRGRMLAAAAAAAVVSVVPLAGQTKGAVPRLADGHPDLQGTYDLATLTPVERAAGSPLVLSDEDGKKGEQMAAARRTPGDAPPQGDRPAPPAGGRGAAGRARRARRAMSAATTRSGSMPDRSTRSSTDGNAHRW